MKKTVLLLVLVSTYLFCVDDTIGVREYKANCRTCHGTPHKGSTVLTTAEWIAMFANNHQKLKKAHENNQKASGVINSDTFSIDSVKLLDFLKNNSLDSGRVRGCSGTSCG